MTKRTDPVATLDHIAGAAEQWATSEERVPVFAVRRPVFDDNGDPAIEADGETQASELITYTMPAKPNPGFALQYLKLARKMGDAASSWLIETAVGEEGYDALAEDLITYEEKHPGGSVKLLQEISQRIQTVAMGGLDSGPKV